MEKGEIGKVRKCKFTKARLLMYNPHFHPELYLRWALISRWVTSNIASQGSQLIGMPEIFDGENEEYALPRCKNIWTNKYPSQPFEISVSFGAWVRYSTNVVATSGWFSLSLCLLFFINNFNLKKKLQSAKYCVCVCF